MGELINPISAFWDNDAYVLVIKKCTKKRAYQITAAVAHAAIYDDPLDIMRQYDKVIAPERVAQFEPLDAEPIQEPPEMKPESPPETEVVTIYVPGFERQEHITFGHGSKYEGMTPAKILSEYKKDGFKDLTKLLYKVDGNMRKAIREAQEIYFRTNFKLELMQVKIPAWTKNQCDAFFNYYGGILQDFDHQEICKEFGTKSWVTAVKQMQVEQEQLLILRCIKKYGG